MKCDYCDDGDVIKCCHHCGAPLCKRHSSYLLSFEKWMYGETITANHCPKCIMWVHPRAMLSLTFTLVLISLIWYFVTVESLAYAAGILLMLLNMAFLVLWKRKTKTHAPSQAKKETPEITAQPPEKESSPEQAEEEAVSEMHCSNCGAPTSTKGSKFCKKCGKPLKKIAPVEGQELPSKITVTQISSQSKKEMLAEQPIEEETSPEKAKDEATGKMHCRNCGTPISKTDAQFCRKCGKPLKAV